MGLILISCRGIGANVRHMDVRLMTRDEGGGGPDLPRGRTTYTTTYEREKRPEHHRE
jgi:hypothetical protein